MIEFHVIVPGRRPLSSVAAFRNMKARLKWFAFKTWVGFGFIMLVSLLLGAAGLTFGGILAFFWLAGRDQRYRQMQIEAGEGEEAQLINKLNDLHDKGMQMLLAHSFSASSFGCRTCGSPNPKSLLESEQICPVLRIEHPHNPNAEPATNNPFAWWWHQKQGFKPPSYKPDGRIYIHPLAHRPDFVQIAREEGKKYWTEHRNYAWDNGYAEPPQWYIDLHIAEFAS